VGTTRGHRTAAATPGRHRHRLGSGDRRHDLRRHGGVRRLNFSESTILANIYAQAATPPGSRPKSSLSAREVVYPQLFKGELGVVPEYSGTAVVALGGQATSDTPKTHDALVDLMKPKDVAVLDSAPAEDRNAIAITLDSATSLNVQTMSDLAKVAPSLTLGAPAECPQRPLCIPGFESTYGIKFKSFVPLDSGVPTALVTRTRRRRRRIGVHDRRDHLAVHTHHARRRQGMFPSDNVTPVVRQEVLDKYPSSAPRSTRSRRAHHPRRAGPQLHRGPRR
jgi:osmoprotectant transport system substrate-binding protein